MRDAKRITIVGGGTSAWMTAAFLNNITKDTTISLIDKTDGGNPVGVVQTILSFKAFMDDCGFPREWFSEVTATFKGGILFENWKGEGEDIWHPFAFPNLDSLGIFPGSDIITIHELLITASRTFY